MLLDGFNRVTQGEKEILLVSGYPGIGKTALVSEIQKPITSRRGYFIQGKFAKLNRNIAYSAIAQAFGSLIEQIMGENDAAIAAWKKRLDRALYPNARVLLEIIPELELLLGEQPEVEPLGPEESKHRFQRTFRKFLACCTRKEHPLVLFVDDLDRSQEHCREIAALVSLASARGLTVLAEGVERESQRARLVDIGCHYYQGFLFGAALSPADFERRFAR